MCGIAGFHGFEDHALLKRMCSVLVHRGPDDHGTYEDPPVSLAHTRLSIIDLSKAGHQPMTNESGEIWITYNGEIYNFLQLRQELEKAGHRFSSNTDTEVVVHAYEQWGPECLSRFRGMFAFAIWDSRKRQLFLARDRLGIKPLYYYWDGSRLIFASEIKAILQAPIKREINWNGIHRYLTFRYNPDNMTAFEHIRNLPPGHFMLFKKTPMIRQYWDVVFKQLNESEKFFRDKILDICTDSVSLRLISDVPLGVFLSGGIDSSSVVGMMSKVSDSKIKTFSVGFGDPSFDELEYARKVSDMYSTDHREFIVKKDMIELFPEIVNHFEEPMSDSALFPTFVLAKNARKYVKVVLTGEGGDEVFAGYEHYKILSFAKKINFFPKSMMSFLPLLARKVPPKILDKVFRYSSALGDEGINRFSSLLRNIQSPGRSYLSLVSIFDDQEKKDLYTDDIKSKIDVSIENEIESLFPHSNLINSLSYYETKTSLASQLLMKVDKMTMAHSLEARVPLLDSELVEFGFQVPPSLKLKGTRDKYIFRNSMRPLLPEKVFSRSKQRFFVPIDKWIEKDLEWLASEILSEKSISDRGYIKYAPIRRIFEKFNKSRLYYSRQIWTLLTLELWLRIFFDQIPADSVMKTL